MLTYPIRTKSKIFDFKSLTNKIQKTKKVLEEEDNKLPITRQGAPSTSMLEPTFISLLENAIIPEIFTIQASFH